MIFPTRSHKQELLDRNDIPFEDIECNMRELNFINTYLGGHDITIAGLKILLEKKYTGEITICEIGCGGGDNLVAINKWCKKNNVAANFIGVDINDHCIQYAKQKNKDLACRWIVSDYAIVSFPVKPHIIFSSLFCHHFTDDQMIGMLHWMKKSSHLGFFINDLHRHFFAYYSIKILTKIFSRSYLVKHDAPLSVLRAFSKNELQLLLEKSGINNATIKWKWAFRWLLVVEN